MQIALRGSKGDDRHLHDKGRIGIQGAFVKIPSLTQLRSRMLLP